MHGKAIKTYDTYVGLGCPAHFLHCYWNLLNDWMAHITELLVYFWLHQMQRDHFFGRTVGRALVYAHFASSIGRNWRYAMCKLCCPWAVQSENSWWRILKFLYPPGIKHSYWKWPSPNSGCSHWKMVIFRSYFWHHQRVPHDFHRWRSLGSSSCDSMDWS